MVDYRRLRFSNLNSPEFRHLYLLLFWIAFGLMFALVELNIFHQDYRLIHCALDERIPFCEWFLLAYGFWFVFMIGMHIYLLLFDVPAFRRMEYFIMLTYTFTMLVYLFYPTYQDLRPTTFARDNFLTRIMAWVYDFDTNTNVCPSLHVIGSMAVAFAAWDTPRFRKPGWSLAFLGAALLICAATVFVKQHSVIDVFWGMAVSLTGYVAIYVLPKRLRRRTPRQEQTAKAE